MMLVGFGLLLGMAGLLWIWASQTCRRTTSPKDRICERRISRSWGQHTAGPKLRNGKTKGLEEGRASIMHAANGMVDRPSYIVCCGDHADSGSRPRPQATMKRAHDSPSAGSVSTYQGLARPSSFGSNRKMRDSER